MSGIRIVSGKKNRGWDSLRSPVTLLFLIAGVFGLLLFCRGMEGISYDAWKVYFAAAVTCTALWYFFFYHRKQFVCFFLASLCVLGVVIYIWREELWEQASYIFRFIREQSLSESVTVTGLMILAAMLLSYVVFLIEFIIGNHVVLYVLTTLLLVVTPLLGTYPAVETILFIVLFQAAFWVLRLSGAGRSRLRTERKARRDRLTGRSALAAGLILLAVFGAAVVLVNVFSGQLYTFIYRADSAVQRQVRHATGADRVMVSGGTVSRANNYQTGREHLTVRVSELPTETIYLKGFTGGDYTGERWESADDTSVFITLYEQQNTDALPTGFSSLAVMQNFYEELYYGLNTRENLSSMHVRRQMAVSYADDSYGPLYTPYFSRQYDGAGFVSRSEMNYAFQYYEGKDMDIRESDLQDGPYIQIMGAYEEAIRQVYTRVPEELVPRLTYMCRHNRQYETPEEVTALILELLNARAVYTLTPGWTPMNKNPVEYFLFESGRGYCQHFASAATLMYRLFGVPARYATGYVVQPSDFRQQEDGSYLAEVTDRDAHAWPEIFVKDTGWTPVEVTPSQAEGSGSVINFLAEDISIDHINNVGGAAGSVLPDMSPEEEEEETDEYDEEALTEEETAPPEVDEEIPEESSPLLIPALSLAGIVILLVLPAVYLKRVRRRRLDTMDCRKVFARFLDMVRFCGFPAEYEGGEKEFPSVVSARLPWLTEQEASDMQQAVSRRAYGPGTPDLEDDAFVRDIYRRSAKELYAGLKWYQKLVFRYWYVFG